MSTTNLADKLKNISAKDRKQIEAAQEMLGPDPATMGVIKNVFWGHFREDLLFPYPTIAAEETRRCDELLTALDAYLQSEHPAHLIDQEQHIPDWVIRRLFELGVLGMTIAAEFGGGGFGITSYNRVLVRIGRTCGSTAVLVSAHQSIGCRAIMLFGTPDQKARFLPRLAKDTLSAFCLSEPNVGCDAGGQETRCVISEDGTHYILNGEKKWATSAALSGLFTVMSKQQVTDPRTGATKDGVTALICTPDMEGIEIFSRNRSKCGIRGTWQARIRFTNVRVPKANLLAKEGRGLSVALTCLNYGRCTLSAGMLGGAEFAFEQAMKWAKYRHQFDRPLGEFDLVKERLARSAACVYAMDAMLYMTTGFLDRGDEDIMLETAMCKVFCSDYGWRTVDDAMQVMGGESYMTENSIERIWRDSRINTIVEGANEVMHSFIFAYGSKQLGEWMMALRAKPFRQLGAAARIGGELFLGMRRPVPKFDRIHPRLQRHAQELMFRIRDHSYNVKMMFKEHEEKLVSDQFIQARLSTCAIWIHAVACSLSKSDARLRAGLTGGALSHETAVVDHLCGIAFATIDEATRGLRWNLDATARACADSVLAQADSFTNSSYSIPERTPVMAARGTGRPASTNGIPQFGSGSAFAGRKLD
ncbi:MAG: acyl-CoA dehydrogenase [Phycisphaerales bacterium]|nr:acyl-CoA dehydrogenase [Phycisphaerales bacterium]